MLLSEAGKTLIKYLRSHVTPQPLLNCRSPDRYQLVTSHTQKLLPSTLCQVAGRPEDTMSRSREQLSDRGRKRQASDRVRSHQNTGSTRCLAAGAVLSACSNRRGSGVSIQASFLRAALPGPARFRSAHKPERESVILRSVTNSSAASPVRQSVHVCRLSRSRVLVIFPLVPISTVTAPARPTFCRCLSIAHPQSVHSTYPHFVQFQLTQPET